MRAWRKGQCWSLGPAPQSDGTFKQVATLVRVTALETASKGPEAMDAHSQLACEPLRLNFPQDFLPERALARAPACASPPREAVGDKLQISDATGIPTGKSTGKVEPMIHYARGMGLVAAESERGVWRLRTTALGELVASEDPFLGEALTQWACHLLLCRRSGRGEPARGIADAWFTLFAEGSGRLGERFSRDEFATALRERHGEASYLRALAGLVPRSYLEPGCLGEIDVLRQAGPSGERML